MGINLSSQIKHVQFSCSQETGQWHLHLNNPHHIWWPPWQESAVSFWTMGIRTRSCDSVQSKKAHGPEALALASLNLQQISTHCRTQRKANSKFTWPCYTPHCRAAWPNCKSSSFLLTAPATMNGGKNIVKILIFISLYNATDSHEIRTKPIGFGSFIKFTKSSFSCAIPNQLHRPQGLLGHQPIELLPSSTSTGGEKPTKDVAISSFYLKHSFQPRVVRALPR